MSIYKFPRNIHFSHREFAMLERHVWTKVLVLLALFAVPSFGETTVASTPISTPPPATVPKVINDNLSDCQKVSEWPEISQCALLLARTCHEDALCTEQFDTPQWAQSVSCFKNINFTHARHSAQCAERRPGACTYMSSASQNTNMLHTFCGKA
jgi:hypothetical protein